MPTPPAAPDPRQPELPIEMFSREMRFLICRWMKEAALDTVAIVGIMEMQKHQLLTNRWMILNKEMGDEGFKM